MSRPDWQRAIKIPLGHIPAGSANGMASSVAFSNDELFQNISLEYFTSTMAFNLNKYIAKPLDLVAIQLESGMLLHSFLNVEWAIVADVDLESERYRRLGGLRFLVGALIRILSKFFFPNLQTLLDPVFGIKYKLWYQVQIFWR